jgi:hypothetical protein
MATPFVIVFLVLARNDGDLTLARAGYILVVGAAAGIVWSLLMWFTVVVPLRKRLSPAIRKEAS